MLTFNDILRVGGVDPGGVRLVRHQDRRAGRHSLYEVWRTDARMLERYQSIQSRDVFRVGEILASFVVTPQPRRESLFIGLYSVKRVRRAPLGTLDPVSGDASGKYQYTLARVDNLSAYRGRLTIEWGLGHRSWNQLARKQNKPVLEIRNEIEEPFPGYDKFVWDVARMDEMPLDWKNHLRHAKGVYLLVDKEDGARYVGSAIGEERLWGRLRHYLTTGHGGNVELRRRGRRPYQASILQIGTFDDEILRFEDLWKQKLMTRDHGLNRN